MGHSFAFHSCEQRNAPAVRVVLWSLKPFSIRIRKIRVRRSWVTASICSTSSYVEHAGRQPSFSSHGQAAAALCAVVRRQCSIGLRHKRSLRAEFRGVEYGGPSGCTSEISALWPGMEGGSSEFRAIHMLAAHGVCALARSKKPQTSRRASSPCSKEKCFRVHVDGLPRQKTAMVLPCGA